MSQPVAADMHTADLVFAGALDIISRLEDAAHDKAYGTARLTSTNDESLIMMLVELAEYLTGDSCHLTRYPDIRWEKTSPYIYLRDSVLHSSGHRGTPDSNNP